jgi:hypothetical protein
LFEITIRKRLSGKEKNRGDEPIQVIIHGKVTMKISV